MRKRYLMNGNGYKLKYADIIDYIPTYDNLTINVRRLMEITDEELLRCRGVGHKSVERINSARKALKELLFTNK